MHRITECAFLTDVEGNFEYFERYLGISKVLRWADDQKTELEFKKDSAMFVFGGDSQDKGTGDIRFTKLLLGLKKKYPDRVEIIIGNRDANKLRLCSELHKDSLDDPDVLTNASFPFWVEEGQRVTPQMFLDKNDAKNGGSENTAANRLRWILKNTMGADGAFDRRSEELSIIRKCNKEAITDDAVVASYRNEADPQNTNGDNFMLQYLQKGKLSYVFGSSLFVHGALSPTNIGKVPGTKKKETSVQGWVKALNAWAQKELKDFIEDPYSDKSARIAGEHSPALEPMVITCHPTCALQKNFFLPALCFCEFCCSATIAGEHSPAHEPMRVLQQSCHRLPHHFSVRARCECMLVFSEH